MKRRRVIYEGKAKILYEGTEPGTVIQYFKDDTTAFDATKKAVIEGKGVLNNRISEYLMTQLAGIGVPTHFVRRLNMREQLIKEVEIIPLEVVVRNVAAGSMSKRLGIEEGTALPRSIIEYYYKNDGLHDPWVSEEHITAFGWASPQDLDDIVNLTIRINDFLSGLFLGAGIKLVDFKLEFGRLWENDFMRIVLADEISPDSCRLWDLQTNEKLDKDRFRRDLGGVVEAYSEVARRLGIMPESMQGENKGSGFLSQDESARFCDIEEWRARSAGQGHRPCPERAGLWRRGRCAPGQGDRPRTARERRGQGQGLAQGDVRKASGQHRDREIRDRDQIGVFDEGHVAAFRSDPVSGRAQPALSPRRQSNCWLSRRKSLPRLGTIPISPRR